MGASLGMMGSARAQYHLRQSAVFLNMHVLNKPELFIAAANTKFDAALKLTDQPTRDVLAQLLQALAVWVRQLQK